ncbi:competence protein ComEA [Streptomyces sp. 846.5]|nr:competence protein ComEA [Streptomyces sp. 846.5]
MDALFDPVPMGRGREEAAAAPPPVPSALPPPAPPPAPPPRPASLSVRRRLPLAVQERLDLDRRAVVGLSVLLVLGVGYGAQQFWAGRPEPVAVPTAEAGAAPSPSASPLPSGRSSALAPSAAGGGVVVDVAGRVREPGVRTLPAGARVQDALKAAGGAAPGTDLTGLNLARRLNDGEEIIVGAAPAAAAGSNGRPAGPLSLNSATVEQLDAMPGIGPVLAQRIIQYREQHGGFTSVDQLRKVSGFGERRLADLRAKLQP